MLKLSVRAESHLSLVVITKTDFKHIYKHFPQIKIKVDVTEAISH